MDQSSRPFKDETRRINEADKASSNYLAPLAQLRALEFKLWSIQSVGGSRYLENKNYGRSTRAACGCLAVQLQFRLILAPVMQTEGIVAFQLEGDEHLVAVVGPAQNRERFTGVGLNVV